MRISTVVWSILFLSGCMPAQDQWEKERPKTVKATGQIFYNGKPVGEAQVFFKHEELSYSAYGLTDKNGHFKLTTFREGDGAIPGKNLVTISKVIIESEPSQEESLGDRPDPSAKRRVLLPEIYGDTKTSGLTADVTEADSNFFTFELTDR